MISGRRLAAAVPPALCAWLLASATASADAPPTARIRLQPSTIIAGQVARVVDRSTDDGQIVRREWDLNDDGLFGERVGEQRFEQAFSTPGCLAIRLRVTDDGGNTSEAVAVLDVLALGELALCPPPPPPPPPTINRPPRALFSFAPAAPTAGESVSFVSGATDPDGPVAVQEWDLDGDGAFDDGSGPMAQIVYPTAGPRTVSLRVADPAGITAVASQIVTVAAASAATPPAPTPSSPTPGGTGVLGAGRRSPTPLLAPITVRIRGEASRRTVRVQSLTVRAPGGSTILVRCSGARCPYREATARTRSAQREVRFKRLELRLPVGTIIRVMVTRAGRIGKYTRYALVSNRSPRRVDQCLRYGRTKPFPCPDDEA
jgi:PKD repeat protein